MGMVSLNESGCLKHLYEVAVVYTFHTCSITHFYTQCAYFIFSNTQPRFVAGAGAMWPTYSSNNLLFAQAFRSDTTDTFTIVLINKLSTSQTVGLTADWQNAHVECVDEQSAFGPAIVSSLTDHTNLPMGPFAVCVLTHA